MSVSITRSYTFANGGVADGGQVDFEFQNIVDTINNANSGSLSWTSVKATTFQAGASGTAGTIDLYPSTSAKGKIRFSAADNSGDTTTTITNASQGGARTYTIPDAGASASFVMTVGTQTVSGTKTFDGQLIGKGTATNDSAAAGYMGEYIESVVGATNAPTSTQYGDLTSISLSAGDWDISAVAYVSNSGATWTALEIGISTTTGNSGTGLVLGSNRVVGSWASTATVRLEEFPTIPVYRMSLASPATVYFKYNASYTAGGPPSFRGRLSARRVR